MTFLISIEFLYQDRKYYAKVGCLASVTDIRPTQNLVDRKINKSICTLIDSVYLSAEKRKGN